MLPAHPHPSHDAAAVELPPDEALRVPPAPAPVAPDTGIDDAALLQRLLDVIDAEPSADRGAMLVRLVHAGHAAADPAAATPASQPTPSPSGATRADTPWEIGLRPLGDDPPLDALLGFTAPDTWYAVGLSCPGIARPLDAAVDVGGLDDADDAEPVHVTVLLARSGASAGRLRRADRSARLSEPPQGVLADACRRALGLPTAPAPASTAVLWTLWWLDRLVVAAIDAPHDRQLAWPEVVALHPAVCPALSDREGGSLAGLGGVRETVTSAAGLAAAGLALAEALPWSRLGTSPEALAVLAGGPAPELAAWMDEGMLARWLLSQLPFLEDLLAAAGALLPDPLWAQVGTVVEATVRDRDP